MIDGCALIDWQELLARCPAVQYLRVTGVDIEDDGSLLRSLASMGGVDEQGGNTPTCRLVGRCRLTQYMDEEELAAMQTHFPELTIEQPAWTCIEFDDAVSDPANISNLDNRTATGSIRRTFRADILLASSRSAIAVWARRPPQERLRSSRCTTGTRTTTPMRMTYRWPRRRY